MAATVLGPPPGDDALESAIESGGDDRALRDVAEAVTALGDDVVAFATTLLVAATAWRWGGRRLALIVALAPLMALLTRVAEAPLGSDAPSGHAAYAGAVLGFAVLAAASSRLPLVAALAALPVLAMPFALILIDSHSPTEAFAGLLLGAGWLLALLATVAGGARPDLRRRRHP